MRAIAAACERHGVPLGAAALQFSLREPRVDATVVGVSTPERLEQTHRWATFPIPDELWNDLDLSPPVR